MKTRSRILHILNQTPQVVSGETLSAELGISRVAVWKHIQRLTQDGVPIVASAKGYRLTPHPDTLSPWVFGERQERIHHLAETSSTMDDAARLVRRGCPDFSVVVADRQHGGRGRMNRSWQSAEGGLYFTVVVRQKIPVAYAGLVNLAAAVDMADILRTRYRVDAGLKWPNDILVDGRKICGVLSQMAAEGDQAAHVNVGIGLNVNNRPEDQVPTAVSLATLLGRSVPRGEILTAFLDAFEARVRGFDAAGIIAAWTSRNITLGRAVRVATLDATVAGRAVAVDQLGGLVIQLSDGSRQTVVYGDCFHV